MYADLNVNYLLFLFDFYQTRNVVTNFSKNPKYEISRKVLLVEVVVCRSDVRQRDMTMTVVAFRNCFSIAPKRFCISPD